MISHRTLHILAHDPPPDPVRGKLPRLPEAALRRAVAQAAALARADGRARHVLFDAAKRRVLVDNQPHQARRDLSVLAVIAHEARP